MPLAVLATDFSEGKNICLPELPEGGTRGGYYGLSPFAFAFNAISP